MEKVLIIRLTTWQFHLEENIYSVGVNYNLSDIVHGIPKLFNKEFPGDLLEIRVLSKINEENKLIILVHTGIDGFNACEKIEKIEDTLYDDFSNNFSNVLFSAEFV